MVLFEKFKNGFGIEIVPDRFLEAKQRQKILEKRKLVDASRIQLFNVRLLYRYFLLHFFQ